MVRMAKALGKVACGCNVVGMEEQENVVRVDAMFRNNVRIVLLVLSAT